MVYEDFEYKRIDSGIEIKKYTGSATSVIIPKYIDDLSVTSIGERAFEDCKSLTSIQIPNSVTSIGELAFWHCESLTSIQIPNSVTSIGKMAFQDCSSLTSVRLLNPNTIIGKGAFEDCSSALDIVRGPIAKPVVDAPKTIVDSHYNQEEKSAEEDINDKVAGAGGCLIWSAFLYGIYWVIKSIGNFIFG